MDTKEWLNQGKNISKEIRALKDALEKSERLYTLSPCEFGERYMQRLQEKIDQLTKTNSDIISTIYLLDDNVLRTLLIERFINDRTWEYVARRLGYDFYHVIKYLYPKAVAEIDKIKIVA